MICKQCGTALPEGTNFCKECGAKHSETASDSYDILTELNKMKTEICELIVDSDEEKKKKLRSHILGIAIVFMLGITSLLTAWSSWMGSLHGGSQTMYFTQSTALNNEGNAAFNRALQIRNQDMNWYQRAMEIETDMEFAEFTSDYDGLDRLEWQWDRHMMYMPLYLEDAMEWADIIYDRFGFYFSPFHNPDLNLFYFYETESALEEAAALFATGKAYGDIADAFGLVSVFFTISLFLLGISNTFKSELKKLSVFCISMVAFVTATAYMLTLPMPTGFTFRAFFGGQQMEVHTEEEIFGLEGTWEYEVLGATILTFNADGTGSEEDETGVLHFGWHIIEDQLIQTVTVDGYEFEVVWFWSIDGRVLTLDMGYGLAFNYIRQ